MEIVLVVIVLLIIINIGRLAVIYWYISLPIIVIAAPIVWFLTRRHAASMAEQRRHEEEQRRRAAAARDQAERERNRQVHNAEQIQRRESLTQLVARTAATAQTLPEMLVEADEALIRAESEFSEGAFAPFWDEVEAAVSSLIRFDQGLQSMSRNSEQYNLQVTEIDLDPPPFEVGLSKLPDATSTIARMQTIVRNAQKSFQFAQIYEQRRTNQLLVGGFASLGQALSRLGDQLGASLDELNKRVSEVARVNDNGEKLVNGIDAVRRELEDDSTARRAHESDVRELLHARQSRPNG
jgi:hypothetical protein